MWRSIDANYQTFEIHLFFCPYLKILIATQIFKIFNLCIFHLTQRYTFLHNYALLKLSANLQCSMFKVFICSSFTQCSEKHKISKFNKLVFKKVLSSIILFVKICTVWCRIVRLYEFDSRYFSSYLYDAPFLAEGWP